MSAPRRCYRHRPDVFLASCADCHAWHMPRIRALRDSIIAAQAAAKIATRIAEVTPATADAPDDFPPATAALVLINPDALATAA